MDLGSSGPVLIPNTDLVVTAGKSGILYLLHRDSMGHLGPDNTSTVQGVQITPSSVFNLAVWANQNNPLVYEFEAGGALKGFRIANGQFDPNPLSVFTPATNSTYAGMAISANGGANGTGIVWVTTGDSSLSEPPGTLHALDASNLSNELWNSGMSGNRDTLGRQAKFVAPTVANGRVYVPTFSNTLATYGFLPSGQSQPSPGEITAVVNSPSFLTGPVSPGELVIIFGANLGPPDPVDGDVDATHHVSESLASAQVLFDGVPAPLLYASSQQLDVIVPFGVAGPNTQIQVLYQSQATPSVTASVQPAAPALFALDGTGGGPGAILKTAP